VVDLQARPKGVFVTILLVEDDAFVREVAGEVLQSAGYPVLKARTAAEARLAFRGHSEPVTLLLADMVLPDRNGHTLALELKASFPTLKIILMSGYPDNVIRRSDLPPQPWAYLPKPFSGESLVQRVAQVLEEQALAS
jgi:two-component system, cell cycle sensor histidine kinase and response regulator CckA